MGVWWLGEDLLARSPHSRTRGATPASANYEGPDPWRLDVKHLLAVVLLATFLWSGCSNSTDPNSTAITFKTDPITCADVADIEIIIDGESQGVFRFTPGSEWSFPVSPGDHSVEAIGEVSEGGFISLKRDVTVPENGNFTVLLTCSS